MSSTTNRINLLIQETTGIHILALFLTSFLIFWLCVCQSALGKVTSTKVSIDCYINHISYISKVLPGRYLRDAERKFSEAVAESWNPGHEVKMIEEERLKTLLTDPAHRDYREIDFARQERRDRAYGTPMGAKGDAIQTTATKNSYPLRLRRLHPPIYRGGGSLLHQR